MTDNENRKHQMFARAHGFGVGHKDDFAANSLGNQLFSQLAAVIAELDGYASAAASEIGSARQGTSTRALARATLIEDLEAISRTARVMATEVPGIHYKFRRPRGENDQQLLAAARAFANDAAEFSAQFIAHELPASFLEDLKSDIAALEAAISAQASGVGGHVAAHAAIDDAIHRGVEIVRKLNAIVKNKYANNPAVLAAWISASHTERAPKHKVAGSPTPENPSPATGGGNPAPPA